MTAPESPLGLGQALGWCGGYVGLLLLCALADVALWRRVCPAASPWLNLGMLALASLCYLRLLEGAGLLPRFWGNVTPKNIFLALACALLFFLTLDKGLDPLLDRWFPQSQQAYAEGLAALLAAPGPALVRVCLIAPVMEETLTRGLLLGGLREAYGLPLALCLSVGVFALLHFDLTQTLSAAVCGLVLGALYLHSGSLLCCILAHAAYNFVSYLALLRA